MDQLPVELLCMIFDRLDLDSIKNASLTCHRFEQIIFSNHYIKRFALQVPLAGLPFDPLDLSYYGLPLFYLPITNLKDEMTQLVGLLQASHRCYPNVTLKFNSVIKDKDHPFPVLFRSMSCHMQDQLVVLKVEVMAAPNQMLEMVYDAVPEMRRLTALHIMLIYCHIADDALQYHFPSILKSISLRYLQLDESLTESRDLSEYSEWWKVLCRKISFEYFHLPNLEHLRLSNNKFKHSSMHSLGTVKFLELVLPKTNKGWKTISAIAEHMPKLTVLKLNLKVARGYNTSAMLYCLHRLTTVRELVLEEGNFDESCCSPKARPMPKLQKLRFQRCKLGPQKLLWVHRLFPNLTQLDIVPKPSQQTDAAVAQGTNPNDMVHSFSLLSC